MENKETLIAKIRKLHEQRRQIGKEIQEISEKLDKLELEEMKNN